MRWCDTQGIVELRGVRSTYVADYIEQLGKIRSAPAVKQHLASFIGIVGQPPMARRLITLPFFSLRRSQRWLLRGPRYSVRKGKTPVLTSEEARRLLRGMDNSE